VRVIDTVGAGDAFAAGLAYGVIKGRTVLEILDVASRLGALVASHAGAIPAWSLAEIGSPGPSRER
jgi:sugar/nucleoside kinase (ribokinase family)